MKRVRIDPECQATPHPSGALSGLIASVGMSTRSRKRWLGLFLIAAATVFVAAAQICLRAGGVGWTQAVWLVCAIVSQGLAFWATLAAYRFERVSVLFPVTALAIPLTVLLAHVLFDEQVTTWRWLGIALIFVGAIVVGSDEPPERANGRVGP